MMTWYTVRFMSGIKMETIGRLFGLKLDIGSLSIHTEKKFGWLKVFASWRDRNRSWRVGSKQTFNLGYEIWLRTSLRTQMGKAQTNVLAIKPTVRDVPRAGIHWGGNCGGSYQATQRRSKPVLGREQLASLVQGTPRQCEASTGAIRAFEGRECGRWAARPGASLAWVGCIKSLEGV